MDAIFTQQNGQPKIVRVLHPKTFYLKGSGNKGQCNTWCGTSSHHYFVTVANLGSKKKKNCGVVCWQRRHHKYLHTAYFFRCISTKDKVIWFL